MTYFHVLKFERKKIKVPELFTICYESVTITKALCNQSSLCFESTPCVIQCKLVLFGEGIKHRLLPDTNLTLELKKKMVNINSHKEPSVLQFALRKKEKGERNKQLQKK